MFEHVKGVKSAISGYAGGKVASPSYEEVSSGATGHAESVRVTYDPSQVTYGQLLRVFFSVAHDPTELNRQVLTSALSTDQRSSSLVNPVRESRRRTSIS